MTLEPILQACIDDVTSKTTHPADGITMTVPAGQLATVDEDTQAIRERVESLPACPVAKTPAEADLFRYLQFKAAVGDERDRLRRCLAGMLDDLDRQERAADFLFAALAEATVRDMLPAKRRSIQTPYGKAGFRKQPARLQVDDEETVKIAAAMGTIPQECVKLVTEARVVKAQLDKLYKDGGEVPPGCSVREETDKFYIGE